MTLHEAIEQVIREEGGASSSTRIAAEINRMQLYRKEDLSDVTASQVTARARKYPKTFAITLDGGITLLDSRIKPYLNFKEQLSNLIRASPRVSGDAPILILSTLFSIHFTRGNIYLEESNYKQTLAYFLQGTEALHDDVRVALRSTLNYLYELHESISESLVKLINEYAFNDHTKPTDEEFGKFFTDIIVTSSIGNSRPNFGEYTTTRLMSVLIAHLYTPQFMDTVIDPFAKNGSLLVEFSKAHKQEQQYYKMVAMDRSELFVNVGSLNLYANAVREFKYVHADAFQQQEFLNADLIISDPPMAWRGDSSAAPYNWQLFPTKDSILNTIQFAIHHLSTRGKAVIKVPESFLFSRKDDVNRLKRYLVEQSLLKGLIHLPSGLSLPVSGANFAILILEKNYSPLDLNSIFIYDASNVPVDKFQDEIATITTTFKDRDHIDNKCKWISKWDIVDNEYDFSVKKYFLPRFEEPEYVPLGTLITSSIAGINVPSDNLNNKEGLPYIYPKDLGTGAGLQVLHRKDIRTFISDEELLPPHENKIIPNRAILLSKIGPSLKPTLFDETFKAVCNSNVIFLTTREDVLPEYLITQLNEDYVKQQLNAITSFLGVTSFITMNEIRKIWIKIIPFEEQQKFLLLHYAKQIATVEQKELQSREDELYNIISRMKHEIQQPNASIGIDIQLLKEYLSLKESSGSPVSLNDYIVPPLPGQQDTNLENTRLKVVLERLESSVKDIRQTLKKAEASLNIGKSDLKLKMLGIRSFIENEIVPLYQNAILTFEIKGKDIDIKADEYQLRLMFKNFIDNAIKHGFNNSGSKHENIIKITIQYHSGATQVIIIIANNGSDFSEGFNSAMFEKKGATVDRDNGSGFGGYHMKKIVENHGGYLRIKRNNEQKEYTEFKVQFEVYLPIHK
jgi:type I restriction-modification system DNA methylase subunit